MVRRIRGRLFLNQKKRIPLFNELIWSKIVRNVLANRLSSDTSEHVLLLEARVRGKVSLPIVKMPGGVLYLTDSPLFNLSLQLVF